MHKEIWKSFREWWIAVPQRWWDVLNVILSALPLIAGIGGVIWKRNTTEHLPIWIIATLVGGALLFIIVSFWAFHRVRMERDQLKSKEIREDIKEIEWRKEYRQIQLPDVTQIPTTLQNMWGLVKNILEEKKKGKCRSGKLLSLIVDLLEIDKNDPILNANNYTDEQKIRKIYKRIADYLGSQKPSEKPCCHQPNLGKDCRVCNPKSLTQCPECIWGQKKVHYLTEEAEAMQDTPGFRLRPYHKFWVYERCPRCHGSGVI